MLTLKLVSVRAAAAGLVMALLATGLAPGVPVAAPKPAAIRTQASETVHAVDPAGHDFALPAGTTHVAVHWPGHPDAVVEAAFSSDGEHFTPAALVEVDEVGAARGDGETYGSVMTAADKRVVRVTADRPLDGVAVLAMDAGAEHAAPPLGLGAQASALTSVPGVIPRSAWGADETIRFDSHGEVRWGLAYFPLQKLIVHHTAGSNYDPNPAATVRAIYHYHAVTQDWGDIGYNYLIDSAGRVYEGRWSREYWSGETPTSDNGNGLTVAGGHALQHNSGTMGIALLGTFDGVAPTSAARASLVGLLAWAASVNGINPTGSSTYVNPVTGLTRYVPNIAGHRSYNSTGCPGTTLNAMLPSIRSSVASVMNAWAGELYNPRRTLSLASGSHVGYRFNPAGGITASKTYTLAASSSAPTSQRATVPGRSGSWYLVTAGVWAGYWIQESARTTLGPAPPDQVGESYLPFRMLSFSAGTYVGRRFNSYGTVIGSKSYTLGADSMATTTEKSTIPHQAGNWYYITTGVWDGYWIQESTGTVLGEPPPPPPPDEVQDYDPPAVLTFAPGTYVGRQFNAFGQIVASKPYTLAAASSAPTDTRSTVYSQSGDWYHIVAGVWDGYWIQEGPGITLADPIPLAPDPPPDPEPPPVQPTVIEAYDPPQTLTFAAGTYVGRQFDADGAITTSRPYTLTTSSAAPTNQLSEIPNQPGAWYFITAGIWAGYWIAESPDIELGGP
jgi:hypothetical protein